MFFARWLDVRFAVACDAMIDDILRGKADFIVTQPETVSTRPKRQSAAPTLPLQRHMPGQSGQDLPDIKLPETGRDPGNRRGPWGRARRGTRQIPP